MGFGFYQNLALSHLFIYTMIETLKAGSLVDYYDLFSDRIGFDKLSSANSDYMGKMDDLGLSSFT